MKNYQFIIYSIRRTDDGYAYDLSRKGEDCIVSDSDYFKAQKKALVCAGTYIDTNGGLILIEDKSTGNVEFVHFHGFSGEVNIFADKASLRAYLRSKCYGMRLIGK